ncbi:MAG: hypothetical protein K1000chlam1_00612 [Candidatus Anoxychlamydiales bacterium]|nr:hypothetical protein [Candidatus Anoxychlamydiales bacterium]
MNKESMSEEQTEINKNKFAEESDKTLRARGKLKKRLKLLEEEITKEALNKKIIEIHDRISRYAATRAVLTRKTISLFDNNQNSAKISNKITKIAQSITSNSKMFIETSYESNSLKNRNINVR